MSQQNIKAALNEVIQTLELIQELPFSICTELKLTRGPENTNEIQFFSPNVNFTILSPAGYTSIISTIANRQTFSVASTETDVLLNLIAPVTEVVRIKRDCNECEHPAVTKELARKLVAGVGSVAERMKKRLQRVDLL